MLVTTATVRRGGRMVQEASFVATAAVIVLLVLIVEMDAPHGFFTVTDLTNAGAGPRHG